MPNTKTSTSTFSFTLQMFLASLKWFYGLLRSYFFLSSSVLFVGEPGFNRIPLGCFFRRRCGRFQWLVPGGSHTAAYQPYYQVDDYWYQYDGQYREENPQQIFHHRTLLVVPFITGAISGLKVTPWVKLASFGRWAPVAQAISRKTVFTGWLALRARSNSN